MKGFYEKVISYSQFSINSGLLDPFAQEGWFWQNPLPQGNDLLSVSFFDSETGFAIGLGGTILRTTNGGIDWQRQTGLIGNNFNSILTTSINNAIAVGDSGKVFNTTNGGLNWIQQTSGTIKPLYNISFYDENNGMVGGFGIVIKTTNGGADWVQLSIGTIDVAGILLYRFKHRNRAWI